MRNSCTRKQNGRDFSRPSYELLRTDYFAHSHQIEEQNFRILDAR